MARSGKFLGATPSCWLSLDQIVELLARKPNPFLRPASLGWGLQSHELFPDGFQGSSLCLIYGLPLPTTPLTRSYPLNENPPFSPLVNQFFVDVYRNLNCPSLSYKFEGEKGVLRFEKCCFWANIRWFEGSDFLVLLKCVPNSNYYYSAKPWWERAQYYPTCLT